jgi:hypothetical protein
MGTGTASYNNSLHVPLDMGAARLHGTANLRLHNLLHFVTRLSDRIRALSGERNQHNIET